MKIPKTVQLTYGDSPGNRNLINVINGNIRSIVNYLLHLDIPIPDSTGVYETLRVDETKQLEITTTPTDATLSYASSDTAIATVSSGGLVTAVAEGQAEITITGAKSGLTSGTAVVVFKVIPADMVKVETTTTVASEGIIEYGLAAFNLAGVEFVLENGYVDMPIPSATIIGGNNKYPAVTFTQETISDMLCYSKITVVPEAGSTGDYITLSAVCGGTVVVKP